MKKSLEDKLSQLTKDEFGKLAKILKDRGFSPLENEIKLLAEIAKDNGLFLGTIPSIKSLGPIKTDRVTSPYEQYTEHALNLSSYQENTSCLVFGLYDAANTKKKGIFRRQYYPFIAALICNPYAIDKFCDEHYKILGFYVEFDKESDFDKKDDPKYLMNVRLSRLVDDIRATTKRHVSFFPQFDLEPTHYLSSVPIFDPNKKKYKLEKTKPGLDYEYGCYSIGRDICESYDHLASSSGCSNYYYPLMLPHFSQISDRVSIYRQDRRDASKNS